MPTRGTKKSHLDNCLAFLFSHIRKEITSNRYMDKNLAPQVRLSTLNARDARARPYIMLMSNALQRCKTMTASTFCWRVPPRYISDFRSIARITHVSSVLAIIDFF